MALGMVIAMIGLFSGCQNPPDQNPAQKEDRTNSTQAAEPTPTIPFSKGPTTGPDQVKGPTTAPGKVENTAGNTAGESATSQPSAVTEKDNVRVTMPQ